MISEAKANDLIASLSGNREKELNASLWKAANDFYKYSTVEKSAMKDAVVDLSKRLSKNRNVYCWILHFINHTIFMVTSDQRDDYIKIIERGFLSFDNDFIKITLEAIARINYLLNERQIEGICALLINKGNDIISRAGDEDYLLCLSSYYYYADEGMKSLLLGQIERLKGNTIDKQFYTPYNINTQEKTDVLFYIPDFLSGKSFLQPPLGELYAATILNKSKIKARIIDNRVYHLSPGKLLEAITVSTPKLIILTTTPYDQVSIYYCDYRWYIIKHDIKILRENGYKIALCGSHGTVNPEQTFSETEVDVIIRGEWENTTKILVEKLNANDWNFTDLHDVPNIMFRGNDGPVVNDVQESVLRPDVNDLPVPDYNLITQSAYYGDEYSNNTAYTKFSWGSILAQRGCPFRCSFCYNFFGTRVRKRKPDAVAAEMEMLERKHKLNHIFFIDYTFTVDRNWVLELCEEIQRRKLTIQWNCETRVDCIDEDLLRNMRAANCNRIWLGIETFSDKLLDGCTKSVTEEQILVGIKTILQSGIKASCFIMLGLPHETQETINYTLNKIQTTGIEYTKSIITVIPRYGTKLCATAQEHIKGRTFEEIYAIRGLIDNDITEVELTQTIQLMMRRDSKSWCISQSA